MTNASIVDLLQRGTVLLDGGMGSSLIARGLGGGDCAELWNVDRPKDVEEIHAAYVRAGCDVIQTNTFGGSSVVLKAHGLADRMAELNRAAAEVARRAAGTDDGRSVLVAGNIGPSGRFLAPVGDADPKALEESFAAQAAALAEGGVDYLAIETMTDLEEAMCALRGALSATDLPVTACLTFDRKKRGFFTLMGNPIEDAVKALADAGAVAVGANCSIGSEVMLEAAPLLVEASPMPVIVKPNAGLPEITMNGPVYRQPPEDFARDVAGMVDAGVSAVGGCCGTDDRFLTALRSALGDGAR